MIEKNKKKENAKKHRVYFDMNLGTRDFRDKKHPIREDIKKQTREAAEERE